MSSSSASDKKRLFTAYTANLGRAPVDGEAAEFSRAFDDADPALLRVAIDRYFADNPLFPRLPGLRAVYASAKDLLAAPKIPQGKTQSPGEPILSAEEQREIAREIRDGLARLRGGRA